MAPQSKANVKLSNTSHDQTVDAVEVMTLADKDSASKLAVYFNSSPFLLDNDTLRDIIEGAALHRPQALSIIIDESTQEQHPDLMLSIQTYCYHNEDLIDLHSVELSSAGSEQTQIDSLSDIAVVIGPQVLLDATAKANGNDKTLIYIPDNLNDQLNLIQLLHSELQQSVICLVNTGMYSDENKQRLRSALVRATDLAIAQDAHLFQWMEAYADDLIKRDSDALAYLVMQYCAIAETDSNSLLNGTARATALLTIAAGNQCTPADAHAMLVSIKTHLSVILGSLPEGADARVWQLLSSLGCTLWFDPLKDQSGDLSKDDRIQELLDACQGTIIKAIGELAADAPTSNSLSAAHIESTLQWLNELHDLQKN